MKLTIPVNWEDDYFDKIDFSMTEEIYGKLNIGLIGGGRPALTMPEVKKIKGQGICNGSTQKEPEVQLPHERDLLRQP